MPSKSLRTDDLLEHILRLCVHHGSGRSPRALWVPRIQLKKHHPRQKIRAQTQEPILHNTCASPSLPPAGFEGNLLQDGPRPRWREPPQAWWRRQISLFHQRERERERWGSRLGSLPPGGMPQPVRGKKRAVLPCSPSQVHSPR